MSLKVLSTTPYGISAPSNFVFSGLPLSSSLFGSFILHPVYDNLCRFLVTGLMAFFFVVEVFFSQQLEGGKGKAR